MAAGMDHVIEGPSNLETAIESRPDLARLTLVARVEPGDRLRLVKFLGYGWSSARSTPAVRDQVEGALAAARHEGWQGLLDGQRNYLDGFWRRADIELEGDDELQQAVRFALFHVLQAACRAERRAIPAKGLTGPGYDGHVFWDSVVYVMPVLNYTVPYALADVLRWRQSTLPLARERAKQLGLKGAAFPWRTIDGRENSSYWPAGTAAFHVNAGVADAVTRYVAASDDREFERETGLEILVETARLWYSLGHFDRNSRFNIDGVTGPDEYSAIADNNVYTNLMAARNLRAAADAAERLPEESRRLNVTLEEKSAWRNAADRIHVPYDEDLKVHPQAERFTQHERWDFRATTRDRYPLLLHFPYFQLYRKQVVKQADLVFALYVCSDCFTPEDKARDFAYYEAITVRDSSLSASIQAVIAAEVGHVELAYDYFAETALVDLHDLQQNTRDGVHMASLAGSWIVATAGLGGMRDHSGMLAFSPRLPKALKRLVLRLSVQGRLLKLEIDHESVRYTVVEGEPIKLMHDGECITVAADGPVTRPMPKVSAPPPVCQPAGREPEPRASHRHGVSTRRNA
jgi:alpha,alpha-trehalose phosphorylase